MLFIKQQQGSFKKLGVCYILTSSHRLCRRTKRQPMSTADFAKPSGSLDAMVVRKERNLAEVKKKLQA